MGPSLQTGGAGQRAAGGRGAPPSLSQAWGHADQRGIILQPAFPKGLSHPSAESGGRGPSAVQGRARGTPGRAGSGPPAELPKPPALCLGPDASPVHGPAVVCEGSGRRRPGRGGRSQSAPRHAQSVTPWGGPALVSSGPSQRVLRTDGGQRVLLAVTQAREVGGTSGER